MLNLEYQTPDYPALNPINVVYVCRGIPLSLNQDDTILYTSLDAQFIGISAKQKYVCNNLAPIRLDQPLRLPLLADNLFDCNYLILQNLEFTNKRMFAFITNVKYINPNMCEVFFQLDIMQTFLFDIDIKQCMVLREHVSDDTIGKNILDEGFQLTEYVCMQEQRAGVNDVSGIRITFAGTVSGIKDNIYSGINQVIVSIEEEGVIKDIIDSHADKPDEILSIQMIPYKFFNKNGNTKRLNYTYTGDLYQNIDGYIPKNKKLFTYPYYFLYADNSQGQGREYRLENWPDAPYFTLTTSLYSGSDITIVCMPSKNYEGWNLGSDISQTLTLSGYPMGAWTSDTFKAYTAQNAAATAAALGSLSTHALANVMTGNPAGAIGNFVQGVETVLNASLHSIQQSKILPDKIHGNEGSNTNWTTHNMDFYFCIRCIKSDLAKTYDDRLSRYGYRIDKVKKPNLNSRKSWNYIRTENAIIGGNIPGSVKQQIEQILNKGITFWHTEDVGNYSLDNSIRSGRNGATQEEQNAGKSI